MEWIYCRSRLFRAIIMRMCNSIYSGLLGSPLNALHMWTSDCHWPVHVKPTWWIDCSRLCLIGFNNNNLIPLHRFLNDRWGQKSRRVQWTVSGDSGWQRTRLRRRSTFDTEMYLLESVTNNYVHICIPVREYITIKGKLAFVTTVCRASSIWIKLPLRKAY